jgi:hypothetical protein
LPEVRDIKEISVDANDDRLMIASTKHGYAFDGFLPHKIDEKKTLAEFDNERMVSCVNFIFLKFINYFILIFFQILKVVMV